MTKAEIFTALTEKAADTYRRKNADYGDSFAKTRQLIPNAILVRLHDKLNRVTSLLLKDDQKVSDESVEDTLLDLANYCLMELTERIYEREHKEAQRSGSEQVGSYILQQIGATEDDTIWVNGTEDGLLVKKLCGYQRDGRCMAQKGMPDCSPGHCPVKNDTKTHK